MRSEKEIDEMIAKLSAAESPSVSAAVMALMWVRGDDLGSMLQSVIERCKMKSYSLAEHLREYWERPFSFSEEIRCAHDGAVCAHSNLRFEDGKVICESCGESLRLAPAQPPHAPATPPQEG